jgi:hypothetical protein
VSMTVVLWKAPVVHDPDGAEALLEPYYEREDESAFAPSADLVRMSAELFRRYPDDDAEERPWADPPSTSDRVVMLHIRWGADGAVLDTILELALKYELVFYDPQGPDIHCPPWDRDDSEPEPESPSLGEYARVLGIGAIGVILVLAAWIVSIPVLSWIVMAVGGFVAVVAAFFLVVSVRHSLFGAPVD